MMTLTRLLAAVLLLLSPVCLDTPVEASCVDGAPVCISTLTPGPCIEPVTARCFFDYGCDEVGCSGSYTSRFCRSSSREFRAEFWAVDHGNPIAGLGVDSGVDSVQVDAGRDDGGQGLDDSCDVLFPHGETRIFSDWNHDLIDGCISDFGPTSGLDGSECMAILLTDQNAGTSYFAAASIQPEPLASNPLGDPSFCGDDGTVGFWRLGLSLAAIPRPSIRRVGPLGSSGVELVVDVPFRSELEYGLHPDPDCGTDLVIGYGLYRKIMPRRGVGPSDLALDSGWTSVTSEPLALGERVPIAVRCNIKESVYLAGSIVFDSGYETAFVSEPVGPIECVAPLEMP